MEDFIFVKDVGGVGEFFFRNPGVFFGRIPFPSNQERAVVRGSMVA